MEAKDTMMKNLAQAIIAHPDLPMGQAIAEDQAEVSFKAGEQLSLEKQGQAFLEGKQAGIKEVVEWVDQHGLKEYGELPYGTVTLSTNGWQAQLKEWGIDNG